MLPVPLRIAPTGSITYLVVAGFFCCSCADGRTITEPPDTFVADTYVEPPVVPPGLSNLSPEHAAWLPSAVTISGNTSVGTAPIQEVTIGGVAASLTGDQFQSQVTPKPGINLLGIRVEATDGGRAVDGRAFHSGAIRPPDQWVPGALGLHWSPAFLDDNTPDKNDIAAVAESLLVDPSVLALLAKPFDTEYAILTPSSITIGSVSLDMVPEDGFLSIDAYLEGLEIAADVEGKSLASVLSGPATIRWDTVAAHIDLVLSVEAGVATAVASNVTVAGTGFAIESTKLDELAVDLPKTAESIVTVIETLVTESVGELVGTTIADALPKLLEGLAYSQTFGTAAPIQIELDLESVIVAEHGVNLVLAARASAPSPAVIGAPGSLITPEGIPTGAFSEAPIALAVDDDLVNQALSAIWQAGIATKLVLEGEGLAAIDPAALPPVFQPTGRILIDLGLPPTLGPRAPILGTIDPSALDTLPFEVAVGEVSLAIETGDSRRFACVINARAGVALNVGEDGQIRATVDTRPKYVELAVGCPEVPDSYDPGSVAALWRLGVPTLLGGATADVALALPGIPLGGFVESETFANTEIILQNPHIGATGDGGRAVLIEGEGLYHERPPIVP